MKKNAMVKAPGSISPLNMKYDIDFERLIPSLSKEEHSLLSESIRKDGLQRRYCSLD